MGPPDPLGSVSSVAPLLKTNGYREFDCPFFLGPFRSGLRQLATDLNMIANFRLPFLGSREAGYSTILIIKLRP